MMVRSNENPARLTLAREPEAAVMMASTSGALRFETVGMLLMASIYCSERRRDMRLTRRHRARGKQVGSSALSLHERAVRWR